MSSGGVGVVTVNGLIDGDRLGVTLTHEHLSMDFNFCRIDGKTPRDLDWTLSTVGRIKQNPYEHHDNLVLNDVVAETAVKDSILEFKKAASGWTDCTVVENSTVGLHRRSSFLADVMRETGVNVVAGTGYYVAAAQGDTKEPSVENMVAFMRNELQSGCFDDPLVKCGFVGEIGISWPIHDFERKVVTACAELLQEFPTYPISFHPGRHAESPGEICRLFFEAGAPKDSKVVISHVERTLQKDQELSDFADEYCTAAHNLYLQFDLFGIENSYYGLEPKIDFPSDARRMDQIRLLADRQLIDRVLLSHDIHTKHRLEAFGGHGFSHLLVNAVPKMKTQKLFTEGQIKQMLMENPQTLLTVKSAAHCGD